jgi:hypothetical protein
MEPSPTSIPEDRPLTAQEQRLARWMLEHGEPGAREFLPQLDRARVVSRCPCGCATLDLQVDGFVRPRGGVMRVLGDFVFDDGDQVSGAFIYEIQGGLAGLEVYGLSGDAPKVLPASGVLRPMDGDSA